MKIHLLLLLAVCICLPALGEDAKPTPPVRSMRVWKVPVGLVPRRLTESEERWDAREWLEANGVKFSPGDEAVCDASGSLLVRAKVETLDSVDNALPFTGPAFPAAVNLRVELTLAEFSAEKVPELAGEMPYAMLRKAAGDSWHVLNHMVFVTISGQRAVANAKEGAPETKTIAPLPEQPQPPSSHGNEPLLRGESGATLEIESVLNENVNAIDVNVTYHYRGPGTQAWEATLPLIVRDGVPMIAQLESAPASGDHAQPAKLRALILRVDVVRLAKVTTPLIQQPASSQPPSTPVH